MKHRQARKRRKKDLRQRVSDLTPEQAAKMQAILNAIKTVRDSKGSIEAVMVVIPE